MNRVELKEEHYKAVTNIYLEGIATGNATFQTEASSWEDWDKMADNFLLERRCSIVGI